MQRDLFETMTLQNKRAEGCIVFPTQHKGEVFFLSHYEVGSDFFFPRNILLYPYKKVATFRPSFRWVVFYYSVKQKAEIFSLNHEGAFRI